MRFLSILTGLAVLLAQSAFAQERLTAAYFRELGTSGGKALTSFADDVATCTNGALEIDIHPGGALGPLSEMATSVAQGMTDLALVPSSTLRPFSDAAGVLSLPFVFNNRRHWETALSGSTLERIREELDETSGLRVLGFLGGEQYGILSNSPITAPDDFDGRKIRAVGPDGTALAALGANPVLMAFAETFSALQTGIVDAMEITAETALVSKYFELAKEFTPTNHRIFTDFLIMNGDRVDALDPKAQDCLRDAANAAAQLGRRAVVAAEGEALSALSEMGVLLNRIEDRGVLFDRVAEVRDNLVSELGAEDTYQLIAAAAGTCPNWCDANTCNDEACEMCRVCE